MSSSVDKTDIDETSFTKRRWIPWFAVIFVLGLSAYLIIAKPWQKVEPEQELEQVEIPKPDTSEMSPQSIAAMNTVYNAVQNSPTDGEAWGNSD